MTTCCGFKPNSILSAVVCVCAVGTLVYRSLGRDQCVRATNVVVSSKKLQIYLLDVNGVSEIDERLTFSTDRLYIASYSGRVNQPDLYKHRRVHGSTVLMSVST